MRERMYTYVRACIAHNARFGISDLKIMCFNMKRTYEWICWTYISEKFGNKFSVNVRFGVFQYETEF